ncbi:hypothetical protein [Micromonospora sp. NPDC051141]|uniref:hypothetical protein n=1 Tax=Micromonospora sp. NPDC051141 TaxID=3364284 RepID=UPI0037AF999F
MPVDHADEPLRTGLRAANTRERHAAVHALRAEGLSISATGRRGELPAAEERIGDCGGVLGKVFKVQVRIRNHPYLGDRADVRP